MENYLSVLLGFAKESTVDWSSRYKIPSNRVLFTQEISQLVLSVWILIPVFKKKKQTKPLICMSLLIQKVIKET